MAGSLIVTAELGAPDFAWLDQLRRTYYPPERNRVPAHLTLFYALPPSIEAEIRSRLSNLAQRRPPRASLEGLMDLGGGVAFGVASEDLDQLRDELASSLHGALGAQDCAGWRPHITIQNKVSNKVARQLIQSLGNRFSPRPLMVKGLALHRYLDGPWQRIAFYPFRG